MCVRVGGVGSGIGGAGRSQIAHLDTTTKIIGCRWLVTHGQQYTLTHLQVPAAQRLKLMGLMGATHVLLNRGPPTSDGAF